MDTLQKSKNERNDSTLRLKVIVADPGLPERLLTLQGREAWALNELLRAGPKGCTPLDNPGPRWSGYVFDLKREHGLRIETVHERHGGQFAGKHARYVLRSNVRLVSISGQDEAA